MIRMLIKSVLIFVFVLLFLEGVKQISIGVMTIMHGLESIEWELE